MGLKKRNKVSPEFSMASLTDVIFLLLIFFVLTSKFVQLSVFELPVSESKTVAPVTVIVEINEEGKIRFKGEEQPNIAALERTLADYRNTLTENKDFTISIAAFKDTPTEQVLDVVEIAGKMRVKAILATRPPEES